MKQVAEIKHLLRAKRFNEAVMACLQLLASHIPPETSPHASHRTSEAVLVLRYLLPSLEGFVAQLLSMGCAEQAMWLWTRAMDMSIQSTSHKTPSDEIATRPPSELMALKLAHGRLDIQSCSISSCFIY
jgi:hypothetical protein